jgi:hypothetical protein
VSTQEDPPSVVPRPARRGPLAQSWQRVVAMFVKEFIQLRRDRPTFAMIVGIPLIQLMLFGYAITPIPNICRRPLAATRADRARADRRCGAPIISTSNVCAAGHATN